MNDDPAVTRLASTSGAAEPGPGVGPADVPAAVADFRIVRLIGAGGMGAVYQAEQSMPRRTVALKVIRPGLATPELRRRFETEVQVLARLQHPGIAQIFQAGVADLGSGPQPYFAMELVRGEPLLEWVDRQRLGTRERLRLLAEICDAVEHAHQRGVIHRDLKPANILVTADSARPKILDFGVARATDSDLYATTHTQLGEIVGTIPYMSPEQVSGRSDELDTRSDVYALGVILFQLLTGRLPYTIDETSAFEAMHTICDVEPTRLAAIDRRYRGDVETIVGTALEKEKDRRYQSAAALAADIRRHLSDEPIVARPPSAGYQLRKFARRHRALVGGIAATFVILAAGAIVSTVQAVRAMRAERLASTRLVEATEARALAQQREAEAMDARQLADNRRLEAEASFARAEEARRLAEAQREANRALLYVSDLTLAQRTLEDGNHARAVELLERHRPAPGAADLRHFEWDHLWRATHRFERAFTLPAAYFIGGFAVAPEAGLVAGGGADGSVRVWEIATGRERYAGVLKGGITQLALSSDGTRVAAGTRANVIAVVDVGSARQIAAFSTTRLPGALRFAGADRLIEAGASVGVIRELTASREVRSDVAPQQVVPGGAEPMLVSLRQGVPWIVTSTGETALTPDGRLRNMAVSEDGSRLMTYTVAGTLALWDTRGKLLTTFPADRAIGGWMALSSQGRYLAALTPPATVTIWEVVTGKAVASLAAPAGIGSPRAVRFSPSGALLAIGGAAGVIVFDVGGGRERALLRGHSASANVVFVDEETVVTQASDSVKVWRLSAQADLAMPLDMRGQVFVQASRDGRWFAAASNETTTRVTPDGARTTVPRSVLRAWTLTGAAMSRPVELPVSMTAVAIAGPRLVLAGDSSGRVHAWDPASDAAPAGFAAHDAAIGAIAVSADGALTATTARPDQIRLWSRRDGRLVTTLAHPMVNDVTFGPAGRMLASCGSDGDVRLWTVGARTAPRVLRAQPGQVQAVAFSPDGRVLASGHVDGQVVLWDVASGREMTRLRGHSGPVQALVFSRDGHRLVSAGGDAAVRLWDMATLGEVQHLRADVSFFNSVDLVPAGLVAGAAGRTPLLLWRR